MNMTKVGLELLGQLKTKNVPKVLKFKINHIFFTKMGGGGVPDLGKIPTFSRFFLLADVPKAT